MIGLILQISHKIEYYMGICIPCATHRPQKHGFIPEEICFGILTYLEFKDATKVHYVCRSFHNVFLKKEYWMHLCKRNEKYPQFAILDCCKEDFDYCKHFKTCYFTNYRLLKKIKTVPRHSHCAYVQDGQLHLMCGAGETGNASMKPVGSINYPLNRPEIINPIPEPIYANSGICRLCSHSIAHDESYYYCFGGRCGDPLTNYTRILYRKRIDSDQSEIWEEINQNHTLLLPGQGMIRNSIEIHDKKLYVFFGLYTNTLHQHEYNRRIYVFDLITNLWSMIDPILYGIDGKPTTETDHFLKRNNQVTFKAGNRIFIFGGVDTQNQSFRDFFNKNYIMSFDPKTRILQKHLVDDPDHLFLNYLQGMAFVKVGLVVYFIGGHARGLFGSYYSDQSFLLDLVSFRVQKINIPPLGTRSTLCAYKNRLILACGYRYEAIGSIKVYEIPEEIYQ